MDNLGLLERVLPEVAAGRGVTQPKEHYWDVLGHSVETVANFDLLFEGQPPADARGAALWRTFWDALEPLDVRPYLNEEIGDGRPRSALLKLAALLHDVAKPETRAPDETGRIRFFGHCERGAEVARAILRRLRFSRHDTGFVATLVEEHLRPGQFSQEGLPTRRALYRFYRDTGEAATGILLLSLADDLAARGPRLSLDEWAGLVAYIAWVAAQPHEAPAIVRPPRLVTGNDLIATLGLKPGPEVGRLLAAIDEAIAAGEVGTRDEALELARRKLSGSNHERVLCGSQP
jgi:putative nucleotidyltransferase with HDIG domain